MMNWTNERPTEPGYYVLKQEERLDPVLVSVCSWHSDKVQKPSWLYVFGLHTKDVPLSEVHGKWFGPIPELP